ncbi:MAG: cytochrome P460 family protein [Planctomycetaceae bacterium]|nr:cytochrome P460 family protein [Planctomycetaceae bacterium]
MFSKSRHRLGTLVLVITTAPLIACLSGCGTSIEPSAHAAPTTTGASMKAAAYNNEGELLRPTDHREWVFVGAPVTPNDMNDGKAAFPEFHNVYIDPASFASYKRTGEFPQGTVILKELVSVGGKSMASGNGYFQGEFISLEAMVKDEERFANEPGGWAFFRFGEAPHYEPTGKRMETTSCNTCHAGADEDYVFTDTYPVLRAAKANNEQVQ